MLYKKERNKESLAHAICIGVVALASIVGFIGCPEGDTTPPAESVTISNLTAASESISFTVANPNAETVRVTVALTPTLPEAARIAVDSDEPSALAGANIELTKTGENGASKQIRITGLANGTAYTVTLTTADSSGNAQQQTVTGSATPLAPPNAPALTVVPGDSSVVLTWTAPTDGAPVSEYRIYRAVGGGAFERLTTNPARLAATTRTYTDTSAANATAYGYRVRAVNTNGAESADSNTAMKSAHFYLHANGVTIVCDDAADGATGVIHGDTYTKRTVAQIRDRLVDAANEPDSDRAADTYLDAARSCTSGITDMNILFRNYVNFNADISHWDTSRVENMVNMFNNARAFDQNIGSWNVAAVTNMSGMFRGAYVFNQDIGRWNVRAATSMDDMFRDARVFNQDIGRWNVRAVTGMGDMFRDARVFNQNIGSWNVAAVTDMSNMFRDASTFNQDLSGWCVSGIGSEPTSFATGTPTAFQTATARKPQWGTCPST